MIGHVWRASPPSRWAASRRLQSGADTPGDGVAQQRNERVCFPRASKGEGCRVRWVGGSGRADRGVVAMAEGNVGHPTFADLTGIAEYAGPAVGLQGGVR